MTTKRVSEYMQLSVDELKAKLRKKSIYSRGKKEALVGRVMSFEEAYENVTLVRDVTYKPTKKDVKYGIVTNLPLDFQSKVCNTVADHLESVYECHNPIWDRMTSARDSFILILRHAMWCANATCGEAAFYLGVTNKTNPVWGGTLVSNGPPDENGKVFVEVLADIAAEIWVDTLGTTWVDDYTAHCLVFLDPIRKIANKFRTLLKNKRKEVDDAIEKKKTHNAMMLFLYGCANKKSGAPILKNIGSQHAFGPTRKKIAQYAGVAASCA